MANFNEGLTKPSLHQYYIIDTSGSMCGTPISQINSVVPEIFREAGKTSVAQESAEVYVHVLAFSDTMEWIIGSENTGVLLEDAEKQWKTLSAGGGTDTATAIDTVRSGLRTKNLGTSNYMPVVILLTDGESNDPQATLAAIDKLKTALTGNNPQKEKVLRIAVGFGTANDVELNAFASVGTIQQNGVVNENVPFVFKVDDIAMLTSVLMGVSIASLASAVQAGETGKPPVIQPVNPTEGDVWEDE